MLNGGNVIFLILHLCAISNARICKGGRGFSENEVYRGSLPGVDERGGVEMNVPVEGNEYDECNDQASESSLKNSVIHFARNTYCTKSDVCAFEPVKVKAHLFQTTTAKNCHKVPEELASHTETFEVFGQTFNETIECRFQICDVTNFLHFSYWHSSCFSTLEVVIASVFALLNVFLILYGVVKCVYCKRKNDDK